MDRSLWQSMLPKKGSQQWNSSWTSCSRRHSRGPRNPPPTAPPVPIVVAAREDAIPTPPAPRPDARPSTPDPTSASLEANQQRQPPALPQLGDPSAHSSNGRSSRADPVEAAPEYLVALVARYEKELAETDDERKATRLHFEIARLLEFPLADLRRAAAHYQEVVRRAPNHAPAIRGARRVLIRRKAYAAALPYYDIEIRLTSDPKDKASLHYARGQLLEDALGEIPAARVAYETAFALNKTDGRFVQALAKLHQRQTQPSRSDHETMLRLYEQGPQLWASDALMSALALAEQGRLKEQLGDIDGAISSFKASVRTHPQGTAAGTALKRLLEATERWGDLAEILTQDAERLEESTEAGALWYRVGRLSLHRLNDPRKAQSAFENARRCQPDHLPTLRELASLYELSEHWDELIEVLSQLQLRSDDRSESAALLCRIGQLQAGHFQDSASAVASYEQVLKQDPLNPTARQALVKLYLETDKPEALLAMHLREAEATGDPKRRSDAHARAGELFEHRLQDHERAIEQYSRGLGLNPSNVHCFHALARLLRGAGRHRELLELYSREIAASEGTAPARAIAYLLKSGAVYEDQLAEPAQALQCYRRALKIDPNNLGALHALQRAAEQAGRYRELIEALELEAEREHDSNRLVALLHRAGLILFERLGDEGGALRQFQKVLSIDRAHAQTLRSLAELFHRLGRYEDLLDCYRRQLPLISEAAESVELHYRMGDISERCLGKDDQAVGYYRKALELDPSHAPSFFRLEYHLARAGGHRELAVLWDAALERSSSATEQALASFRLGELYEGPLQNPERALAYYEAAENSQSMAAHARSATRRILTKLGRHKDVLRALELEESSDPAALHIVRGEVWANQVGNLKQATEQFEAALADPAHELEALDALEKLYCQAGAWSQLARVYRRQAELARSVDARGFALQELARLQERFGSIVEGGAYETYLHLFELLPHDFATLDATERYAVAQGDSETLQAVNDAREASNHDAISQATQLTRTGEYLERLGKNADSLAAFQQALEVDPENLGAVRGIGRIAEDGADPNLLAEAARLEASVALDGEDAARLLTRSARLRADQLGDHEGAVRDLERALELHPDHVLAAHELTQLLTQTGEYAKLADLLGRAANGAQLERSVELWSQVAELYALSLGNVPGAISCLHRVLRAKPDHVPTLARLAQFFSEDAQWTEACNLWARVVHLSPDRAQLRDAHMALADLWEQRLGDTGRALLSLQAALALDTTHLPALHNLAKLLMNEGKLRDAERIASRYVEATSGPRQRSDALLVYAQTLAALDRANDAYLALLEAAALGGASHSAATRIKSQAQNLGDWADYRNALGQFLLRHGVDVNEIRVSCLEKANVEASKLNEPDSAVHTLRQGLEALPDDVQIRGTLSMRLRHKGRLQEALIESRQLVRSAIAEPECWRELARNYDAVGKPESGRLSLMPLRALQAANDQEMHRITTPEPSTRHMPDGKVRDGWLGQLEATTHSEQVAEALLAVMAPGLHKFLNRSLEPYGLSSRDRLSSRRRLPVKELADHLATVLGIASYELYIHRIEGRGVVLEPLPVPAIMIPESLASRPQSDQIFFLGRPLALVSSGLAAVAQLAPHEVEGALSAVVNEIDPTYKNPASTSAVPKDQGRKIIKSMPRRDRKRLEELAGLYTQLPPIDAPHWCRRIHLRAVKAAGVIANDLGVAVEALQRFTGTRSQGVLYPELEELLQFWVSDEAFSLRSELGLGDG